jgi:hypothetical protein
MIYESAYENVGEKEKWLSEFSSLILNNKQRKNPH